MGYHVSQISKGQYGEMSKIVEELEELIDAENQKNVILQINEICDLIGAIDGYLSTKFPSISLDDCIKMMRATQSAFQSGERK